MAVEQGQTLDELAASGWKPAAVVPATPQGPSARPEIRRTIASGRGTQFDPTLPNRAVEAATTPLAEVTGVPAIDSFTSPVGLASLAAGGVGIARAGASGGAMAAAKTALAQAAPIVKYEAVKAGLHALHIPEPAASLIAAAASGYRSATKATASEAGTTAEAVAAKAAPISPVESVSGGTPLPSGPPPESVPASAPTPPPADSLLSQTATAERLALKAKSPQQTLNEEALARRRTAAQGARQAPPDPAPKPSMTAAESKVYLELRIKGKTDQQAREAIEAARTLNARLGLSTPTPDQTKFPKGMRGKPYAKPPGSLE